MMSLEQLCDGIPNMARTGAVLEVSLSFCKDILIFNSHTVMACMIEISCILDFTATLIAGDCILPRYQKTQARTVIPLFLGFGLHEGVGGG